MKDKETIDRARSIASRRDSITLSFVVAMASITRGNRATPRDADHGEDQGAAPLSYALPATRDLIRAARLNLTVALKNAGALCLSRGGGGGRCWASAPAPAHSTYS